MEIAIGADDLAYWSVRDQAWVVEGGDYTVEVGASSRDLRLSGTVSVAGNEPFRPLALDSTVAEAMQVPAFAEMIANFAGAIFGGDPEMVRMMESVPLAALAGFGGMSLDTVQGMLDEANAARS